MDHRAVTVMVPFSLTTVVNGVSPRVAKMPRRRCWKSLPVTTPKDPIVLPILLLLISGIIYIHILVLYECAIYTGIYDIAGSLEACITQPFFD